MPEFKYTRNDLHPYQVEAISELVNERTEVMLWAGLGAGKTVVSLTGILDLDMKALVVGTLFIINQTWPEQIAEWEHLQGLTYAPATGSKRKREKAIESDPQILGVNYENLRWLYSVGGHVDRPILVLDECSKMKSHSTKRFSSHVKFMGGFSNRWGLTATPAAEDYLGLYGQQRSLIEAAPLGRTVTEFRANFTKEDFKGNYTKYTIPPGSQGAIRKFLEPWVLHVEDKSAKRSAPTVVDRRVPWAASGSRAQYKEMERELVVELENQPLAAVSRAGAWNKCRQMAIGFVYDEEKVGHELDVTRMEAVAEAYEELGGEPVLLLYSYGWECDWLLENLPDTAKAGDAPIQKWKDGKFKGLVAHAASVGHGLNFQGHCRHVFWASLPTSLELYLQANGRVDRQGQKDQVVITRFLREGTLEEEILGRLEGRFLTQEELINHMKERQ